MDHRNNSNDESQSLLARLKAFFFPGGEDAARRVRGVTLMQRGELCSGPGARWMPFTAEQRMDATQSSFCWNARFGGRVGLLTVTDAYEELRGRLVLKLGGVMPVKKFAGADVDKGEMQRYLAEILMCPSILLNHSSLEFTGAGDRVLRVRDRQDSAGATVDYEINEEGRPVACRADRPRLAGKKTVLTPWSGACQEFQEWEGLRVARRVEVSWHLPDGSFTYFRCEVTSCTPWN